eukprot:tig00000980_g6153.t1
MASAARPYAGRAAAEHLIRATRTTAELAAVPSGAEVSADAEVKLFTLPKEAEARIAPELASSRGWPKQQRAALPPAELIGAEAALSAREEAAMNAPDDALEPAPQELNPESLQRVLFSFAGQDTSYVDKLVHYLRKLRVNVHEGWSDVPRPLDMTARSMRKWRKEVLDRFSSVGAIVCVFSPDFEASTLNQEELALLLRSQRIVVPLMRSLAKSVPGALAGMRWVRAEGMDVEEAAASLAEYLRGDLAYSRDHTWLSRRAQAWATAPRRRPLLLPKKETVLAESVLWRAARGAQPPASQAMIDLWKASYGYNLVASSWQLILSVWLCVIFLALGAVATYFAVANSTRRC